MIGESLWIYAAAGMHFLSKRLLAPSEVSGALIFLPLPWVFFSPASAPRQQSPIALCSVMQLLPLGVTIHSECVRLTLTRSHFLPWGWMKLYLPQWDTRIETHKTRSRGSCGISTLSFLRLAGGHLVSDNSRHSIWAEKSFVSSTAVRPEAW